VITTPAMMKCGKDPKRLNHRVTADWIIAERVTADRVIADQVIAERVIADRVNLIGTR